MSVPPCDRAALVEAMFDRRLGPSEHASMERHLKQCALCSERLRDLDALQQALRSTASPISPLEHQRARLALLRRTAAPAVRRRAPVALIAAALITLPLAVWASTSSLVRLRVFDAPRASLAHPSALNSARERPHARSALVASAAVRAAASSAPAFPAAPPVSSEAPPSAPARPRNKVPVRRARRGCRIPGSDRARARRAARRSEGRRAALPSSLSERRAPHASQSHRG